MSGGTSAATLLAYAAVAGTAYSVYAGERSASAQKDAQNQARSAAQTQAKAADEATNRANQKTPDTSAILAAQNQAGKGGQSGTMLTGSSGIDPAALQLAKSTLLGQ